MRRIMLVILAMVVVVSLLTSCGVRKSEGRKIGVLASIFIPSHIELPLPNYSIEV
jgi:hypothetical protein